MANSKQPRMTVPAMRWMLAIASLLVLIIGTPLFLVPTETATLFSWTVNPPLTAAFLGAGYISSFFLEFLSSRERIWARTRVAVPSVVVFTSLTLVATLVHLDKFHFGADFSFLTQAITWVWLLVYAVVPVILIVLLVLQLRAPGGSPARVAELPVAMRILLVAQALVMAILGGALFIAPTQVAPNVWPWTLSALTSQAVGAFLIGTAIVAGWSAWENDLVRLPGAMAAYSSFGILQIVALARYAGADNPKTGTPLLDWADSRPWLYLAFFLSISAVGVWGWLGVTKARATELQDTTTGTAEG